MIISLLGALTGVLTAALPEGLDYFKKKQEHVQEVELMKLQAKIAETTAKSEKAVAALAADAAVNVAVYDQYSKQPTSNWVDKFNALMRPSITLAFLLLWLFCCAAFVHQAMSQGVWLASALTTFLPFTEAALSTILAFFFTNRQIQYTRGRV